MVCIYGTLNGGANWFPRCDNIVNSDPSEYLAIACPSKYLCYVGGTPAPASYEGALIKMTIAPAEGNRQIASITPAFINQPLSHLLSTNPVNSIAWTSTNDCEVAGGLIVIPFCSQPPCAAPIPYGPDVEKTTDGGHDWSEVYDATQAPENGASFNAIACASENECYAVGSLNNSPDVKAPNAGIADAVVATTTGTPLQFPLGNFSDIACPSTTICYATRTGAGGVLFNNLNKAALPAAMSSVSDWYRIASSDIFNGISCPKVTRCFAVGGAIGVHYAIPYVSGSPAFILPIKNGNPRSVVDVAAAYFLNAIACPTTKVCYAVGEGTSGNVYIDRY